MWLSDMVLNFSMEYNSRLDIYCLKCFNTNNLNIRLQIEDEQIHHVSNIMPINVDIKESPKKTIMGLIESLPGFKEIMSNLFCA